VSKASLKELSKILKDAEERQFHALIEIIYNSYDVPLTLRGRKLLSSNKKLIKYFRKRNSISLTESKKHMILYKKELQQVVALILSTLLENAVLQACLND